MYIQFYLYTYALILTFFYIVRYYIYLYLLPILLPSSLFYHTTCLP